MIAMTQMTAQPLQHTDKTFTVLEVKVQYQQLYITVAESYKEVMPTKHPVVPVIYPDSDGEAGMFWFGQSEHGVIEFGYQSYKYPPGHGGFWSSNSQACREYTGVHCMEAAIKTSDNSLYCSAAITLELAQKLLPEGYLITFGESGFYKIRKKGE